MAVYEPYADSESTWGSLRSIGQLSSTLTTLYESGVHETDTLYPEFLYDVLNTDYIFQIGSYLVKIDLLNDRGLVISEDAANAYLSLVNNNLTASGMMVLPGDFDFGLEFMEGLADNTITPANYQDFLNAERACPGAQRRKKAANPIWDTNGPYADCIPAAKVFFMDNKLAYQKAIFFFSLQSKVISRSECIGGGNQARFKEVDLNLQGTVKYRIRCSSESNQTADIHESFYGGNNDAETNWRPFSGGRSLSHYDFTVRFGIRYATDRDPNPPPYIYSPYYNIKSGY